LRWVFRGALNKDKTDGVSWYDAIMKLDEIDRIVSMLTQDFDPCAFSVHIEKVLRTIK
jgi:hypothetical protein